MGSGGFCHYCKKSDCICFPEYVEENEKLFGDDTPRTDKNMNEVETLDRAVDGGDSDESSSYTSDGSDGSDGSSGAFDGLGCAFVILAIGVALTLVIWALSGFPAFWK